jgi:hypothetical protein
MTSTIPNQSATNRLSGRAMLTIHNAQQQIILLQAVSDFARMEMERNELYHVSGALDAAVNHVEDALQQLVLALKQTETDTTPAPL